MRYLITALLLLCAVTMARAGVFVGFGQGSGTTEPATGTVILGTTSTNGYTNDEWVTPISYEEHYNNTRYTATWAESASTTTMSTAGLYLRGRDDSRHVKLILRDTNLDLIAVSNELVVNYEETRSLHEFTFSTPPTITKGSSYIISVFCAEDYGIGVGTGTTGTDLRYGTNGTYASPAATLTETAGLAPGIGPFYGKK